MKTLIIAEKNSVMQKIAESLTQYKSLKKNKGYYEDDNFIYTHCVGHLLRLKMPNEMNPEMSKWSLSHLPFFFDEIDLVPSESVKDQFNIVKSLLQRKDITEIINACDPDREGELIFRNLYYYCKTKCQNVSRMWIETVGSKEALKEAYENRKKGALYDNLYKAAKARSYADYFIGLNSTEGMTVALSKDKKVLSIGRVQTPTLKMIVDRENEINNFKAVPFWKVIAHTDKLDGNYINPNLEDNRFYNENDCNNLIKKVGLGEAVVKDVLIETTKDQPRKLFNLSDLQIEMNKKYKYSPQEVLDICQSLYERHGLTTYPRTAENRISPELASKQELILKGLPDSLFKRQKEEILENKWCLNARVIAKKDIGAHEALTPVPEKIIKEEKINGLNQKELNVYKAIVERFLSNFYPDAVYEKQTIVFTKNDEDFKNTITNLVYPGHFSCYESFKGKKAEEFIKLNKGDTVNILELEKVESKTEPPARFTEGTLIKAMQNPVKYVTDENEKNILKEVEGIGTEATRAQIIETLKKQNYIEMQKSTILPTARGMSLIEIIPNDLIKSVSLTAQAEKKLSMIAKGEYSEEKFLNEINELNVKFINSLKNMKKEEINSKQISISNEALCKCPNCNGNIKKGKFGFYCENKCGVSINTEFFVKYGHKKISDTEAKELLTKGKTKKEIKFISPKNGKDYKAYIVYKFMPDEQYKNKLSFEFKNNK